MVLPVDPPETDDGLSGAVEAELCGYCEHPEDRHRENTCRGEDGEPCDCLGFNP